MLPSVLTLLDFSAGGVVVEVVARATGGIGHKRYPRKVFFDGRVFAVKNADEERRLLQALAEEAREQAKIAEALDAPDIVQAAIRKAVRLSKRAEKTEDRAAAWLRVLIEEDNELISLMFGNGRIKEIDENMLGKLRDEDEEILTIVLH